MNKQEFINELDLRFDNLIHKDAKKLLEYFNELYDDKLEDGFTDIEIIKSFGDVDLLADKLISELNQSSNLQSNNKNNIITNVFKTNEINLIDINIRFNDITISQSIDDDIHIEYSSTTNNLKFDNKKIYITDLDFGDNNSIITTTTNSKTLVKFKKLFCNSNNDFLELQKINIKLPKNNQVNLNIKTISADILIDYMDKLNFVKLNSTSGDIEIESINYIEKLDILTSSGDLLIKNNPKVDLFNFKSSSGDVKVVNSNFLNLAKLKCSSGDIFVQDSIFYDNTSIKTISGDFDLQHIIVHKDIESKTTSGDGTIRVIGKPENFELINKNNSNNLENTSNLKKIIYSGKDIEIVFI